MTDASGARFDAQFRSLLESELILNPEVFTDVDVFDEIPIYSRYSQLDFLSDLSTAQQNRELILAAVRQLDRVEEYFCHSAQVADGILRMVTVTGWWVDDGNGVRCDDGTTELLTPHLWIGNLLHPSMEMFRVATPESTAADRVTEIVDSGTHEVFESMELESDGGCPVRVYLARAGRVPNSIKSSRS